MRWAKKKQTERKKAVLLAGEAELPKQQARESPGLFCPKSFVCPQLVPFPLGIKGCQLKTMSPGSDSTFLLSAIYLPFSVTQSVAISFLRASLGNRG